jgi:hypothetical protein
MKWWLPVIIIVPAGLLLSAYGGDPVGSSLLLHGGVLLIGCFLFVSLFHLEGKVFRHVALHLAGIAILLLAARTHFPFRATFAISEPALRQLAMRVVEGGTPARPVRAGLFKIKEAGRKADGSVYLWTSPHPGGSQGFVFRYTGREYNLWSELRFNNDWYYICED